LKRYVKKKRSNYKYKTSLQHKEEVASTFYKNLLKSRAFFALLKWNRCMSYYHIIKQNHYDYKLKVHSKFLIKSLIYTYNRKKLVDVFLELKNRKLVANILTTLNNKTKFRINQKKIYLSQLVNNQYTINFLLYISYHIFEKGYSIQQKPQLKTNFDKMLIKQKLNNLKGIFDNFCKGCYLFKEESNFLKSKAEQIKDNSIIKDKQLFFKAIVKTIKHKTEITKFKKRLFLLRYYYKRFKFEKISGKIQKSKRKLKNFIIAKIFQTLKTEAKVKLSLKAEKGFAAHKNKSLKLQFFKALQKNLKLAGAKNIIIKQQIFCAKLNFFRKMRILIIESLLAQGLINRIEDYQKRKLLGNMLKTSLYLKKAAFFQRKKNKLLKRKAFFLMKGFKTVVNDQITQYIRFIFNVFTKLVIYKKHLRKNIKNKIQRNLIIFYYRLFFTKIKGKAIKIDVSAIRKPVNNEKLKLYFSLFINKVKAFVTSNQMKLINARYLIFKSFLIKANNGTNISLLKKAAKRYITFKNSNYLFSRISKKLEKRQKLEKVNRLVKTYYFEKIYEGMEYYIKTKSLEHQISMYYNLKVKKRILNTFKNNYSNILKYRLIERRYKDYLIITSLKYLTSYIIEKHALEN
jgi:hypothetical protein